jgi:hypothetical protein
LRTVLEENAGVTTETFADASIEGLIAKEDVLETIGGKAKKRAGKRLASGRKAAVNPA